MDWFEWAFIAPVVGWLGREIWANISQNKFMRKQSENEHLYFKKRLIFEQKHEVYKELYKRVKHMVGILNDFNFFDERTMAKKQEAVNSYFLYKSNEDNNFDSEKFNNDYNNNEQVRLKINLYYYLEIAQHSYLDFKNYVAEQNYILTKEENEILNEIDTCRNELFNYINEVWSYFEEDEHETVNKCRRHFSNEYQTRFKKIDDLIYKFSDTIREEMFL